MKTIYMILLLVSSVSMAWGQKVSYEYDAAGNRKLRKTITLKSVAENDRTDSLEIREPEIYKDMLGERKVTIYPNPTRGMIRIEFQGYEEMGNIQLYLYDTNGRLLQRISKVQQSHTLDLSAYPSGMYILWLTDGQTRSEWKIIKE